MDYGEYHKEIEALAEEAAKRIRAGEDQGDVVHELVDGHQWVIYTARNYEVMAQSPVDAFDAYKDDFGENLPSSAVGAYICMEHDVNDRLSRMDLDAPAEEEES